MGAENSDSRPAKRLKYFAQLIFQGKSELTLRRPDYSTDVIVVLVGFEEKKFTVHKDRLCKRSEFLQAACAGGWKEDLENTVRLPETEPPIFNLYVHWLYTGTFDVSLIAAKSRAIEVIYASYSDLADAWVLGNFLLDEAFANQAVDHFLIRSADDTVIPCAKDCTSIWNRIPTGSGLQRLLLDVIASWIHPSNLEKSAAIFPFDMVKDLALRYVKRAPRCPLRVEDRYKYHSHEDSEETCK